MKRREAKELDQRYWSYSDEVRELKSVLECRGKMRSFIALVPKKIKDSQNSSENVIIELYMPKVTRPFWSLKAAGDFADVLQFVCGHYVREKPRVPKIRTSKQNVQRLKFKDASDKWSKLLDLMTKVHWTEYVEFLSQLPECESMDFLMSGYDMWMSYYLQYGDGGWDNYPEPPDS